MATKNCGKDFKLGDDSEILKIVSPEPKPDKGGVVGGPYTVVYKEDLSDRWAIVALDWGTEEKNDPRLGIRWFYGNHGYPSVCQYKWGVWFIIPPELSKGILATLDINVALHTNVTRFLSNQITGDELRDLCNK